MCQNCDCESNKNNDINFIEDPQSCKDLMLADFQKIQLQNAILLYCVIALILGVIYLGFRLDKINRNVWRTYYLNRETTSQLHGIVIDREGNVSKEQQPLQTK